MSSASRTLELLRLFSAARPEIGLSQLCRLAGRDKATAHRHQQALEAAGIVEQNPMTRQYRLGPRLLHLAQLRERTVPRESGAIGPLRDLAQTTGETAHVSALSGPVLSKLLACESPRHSLRVVIDIETFPLHATASGLCALAFGPEAPIGAAEKTLEGFTRTTIATAEDLRSTVQIARDTGLGRSCGNYEAEVCSLAAPLFDQTGCFAGAVSVACVASRFTPDRETLIRTRLIAASRDITHNWGGGVPANVKTAWAGAPGPSQELELTP